jgi:hypothetical protein
VTRIGRLAWQNLETPCRAEGAAAGALQHYRPVAIAAATHPDEQAAPRTGLARQCMAAAAAVAARRHNPGLAVRHRGLAAGMQATLHQRHQNPQQVLPA